MRRVRWFVALALLLFPGASQAIQLQWSSGADTLTFTEATRCMLVLRADSAEVTLPPEWRLLWVADSAQVQIVELDSLDVCQGDTANVFDLEGPSTPEDSTANLVTAHFCSGGSSVAAQAGYVLDLPAWARGKLKVVAVDPADSSAVIESNEVTFNGGIEATFPSVILRAFTFHQATEFRLSAVGACLAETRGLELVAPDGSWRQPLNVTSQGDEAITATASLAAQVPACILQAVGENNAIATAIIAADPPPPALSLLDPPEGCETRMREVWSGHDPYLIQPKDFAFVPGGWTPAGTWLFHLFYIRKNQYLLDQNTEKNIGHAVSDTLSGWTVIDTAAIRTRGGRWDSLHVWAPSIVRKGLTYHMFYTGVDKDGNQRIGIATSTDLVHWAQGDSVLEVTPTHTQQIPWADPTPSPGTAPYHGKTQLRDPFVMEDPDSSGDWLMYFVTVPSRFSPEMVVGVARSHGNFTSWGETFPLWNTHRSWPRPQALGGGPYVVESPHAFFRGGNWWLFSTVNNDSVWAESNAYSPTDTLNTGARWIQPQKLCLLVPPLQTGSLYYWHATEYLQISAANDIEYLAGFNESYAR
jgi:hypothetical protein